MATVDVARLVSIVKMGRYYAVKTLLLMTTPDTQDPILTRLSKMMDYDSLYVRSLILNHSEGLMSISVEMADFTMQKATVDHHYVIRTRGREFVAIPTVSPGMQNC